MCWLLVRKRSWLLLLACLAVWACRETAVPAQPANSQGQEALIGFPSAVDIALLRVAGVTILAARASPPAARVSGSAEAIAALEANPAVSYVLILWLIDPGDSTSVMMGFRDRPTAADTLSDADRDLVASVGGRIRFLYVTIPAIDVVVPVWGLPTLKTNPAVTSFEMDSPIYAD